MIKPITTYYRGYKMKSRLEARWAAFFTAMGLTWVYEPEGFDMKEAGWYLPDFWIEDLQLYVEIKPRPIPGDSSDQIIIAWKCIQLARMTCKPTLLISGQPYFGEYGCGYVRPDIYSPDQIRRGCFAVGRRCDHLWLFDFREDYEEGFAFNCDCPDEDPPLEKDIRLEKAYICARNLQ